jgi:[CysO sulfur-carrier protein]-S-L-cysteine hydrolase
VIELAAEQLAEICRRVQAGYPEEVFGLVIGRRGAAQSFRIRPMTNLANRQPVVGPDGVPRDARTAYMMDAREYLTVQDEMDRDGLEMLMIYHSHPDHDANFSQTDRQWALRTDGEPLWPGITYLVVSVRAGQAVEASSFGWDPATRDFARRQVEMPAV